MKFYGKVYSNSQNTISNSFKVKPKIALIVLSLDNDVYFISIVYKSAECTEHKYKINRNIKTLYTKQLSKGKFGISFLIPLTSVFIETAEFDKAKLLCLILAQHNQIEKINFLPSQVDIAKKELKTYQNEVLIHQNNFSKPKLKSHVQNLKILKVKDLNFNSLKVYINNQKFASLVHLTLSNCNNLAFDCQIYVLRDSNILQQLVYLDISHNSIEVISPNLFETDKTYRIQSLNLSYNKLQTLPNTLFVHLNKSLLHLQLNNNNLQKVPQNLGNLKSLKVLTLESNDLEYLPHSIFECSNLQKMFIDSNQKLLINCTTSNTLANDRIRPFKRWTHYVCNNYQLSPPLLQSLAIKYILKNRHAMKESIPKHFNFFMNYETEMCQCNCPIPKDDSIKLNSNLISLPITNLPLSAIDVSSKMELVFRKLSCSICQGKDDAFNLRRHSNY